MNIFLYRRYKIKSEKPEKTLTALLNSPLDFSRVKREEDGVSFCASFFYRKKIKALFGDVSYQNKGLISRLFFLKKRLGLLFGALLGIFLIYLSTFYVWSVRIEGNEELEDEKIERILYECGFHEGVKKSLIDVNALQNEVLSRCHELSFCSVNIHGMTADVVVHERVTVREPTERDIPYNLVSDADGVILSFVILDGQRMFEVGDTVTRGQLLVSGIIDSTSEGYRLRQAEGKVWAKTYRTLNFSIPLKSRERILVGEEYSTRLSVLGHSIGRGVGKKGGDCDIELVSEPFRLFGVLFPIKKESLKASYYSFEECEISEDEAKERLILDYKKYLSTELDSGEVAEEEFFFEVREDEMCLRVELTARENIAVKEKIKI